MVDVLPLFPVLVIVSLPSGFSVMALAAGMLNERRSRSFSMSCANCGLAFAHQGDSQVYEFEWRTRACCRIRLNECTTHAHIAVSESPPRRAHLESQLSKASRPLCRSERPQSLSEADILSAFRCAGRGYDHNESHPS